MKRLRPTTEQQIAEALTKLRAYTDQDFRVSYGRKARRQMRCWLELEDQQFGRVRGYMPASIVKFLEGFISGLVWARRYASERHGGEA